jgi:phosphate acetyltransferase
MPARAQLQKLVERARLLPPLPAAFAFPCDADTLQLALAGEFAGYLAPTLVGPQSRIRDAALRAGIDISRLAVVDTADDPRVAAERAVALARDGTVDAIVKGTLPDGALLAPVASPEGGLRTSRRLSHATLLDVPGRTDPLIVADDRLNVSPPLAAKRDILDNTVEFAIAIGLAQPAVALLAAVGAPSAAFASTVDAVALKTMAANGAIHGARVDGPMTPDVALARGAAAPTGVAGQATVLIAPTMESAVMVVRTLCGATGALAAGLVLGARVPVVIASRGETMESRMASCVLASLAAEALRPRRARAAPPPARADTPARVAA